MKVGYHKSDFMPYDEVRRHGRIIVSDGYVIAINDSRLYPPAANNLPESKKYTSGTYKNLPEMLNWSRT